MSVTAKAHIQTHIVAAHKITTCVDGWTKKNLASSFLEIPACFFDMTCNSALYVVLSIAEIPFPHTGIAIAKC